MGCIRYRLLLLGAWEEWAGWPGHCASIMMEVMRGAVGCCGGCPYAGLCLDPPEPLIITEFYPRGNLFDLIQKVRFVPVPRDACTSRFRLQACRWQGCRCRQMLVSSAPLAPPPPGGCG